MRTKGQKGIYKVGEMRVICANCGRLVDLTKDFDTNIAVNVNDNGIIEYSKVFLKCPHCSQETDITGYLKFKVPGIPIL